MIARGKGEGLPEDDEAYRVEFDGDKLGLGNTIEDVGVEDGDRLDVSWK